MKSKVRVLIFSIIGAANFYPQAQSASAWTPSPVAPVQGPTRPSQSQPASPNQGQSPLSTPVSPNGFVTNAPGMVPQFGGATDPFGVSTNQPGALGGASAPGFDRNDFRFAQTNLEMLSNQFGAFNHGFGTNNLVPDEAFTPQDRMLGFELRRQLLPEIRETLAPIHLAIQNGVVMLSGRVPSQEDQQEIEDIVRRTPGVVNVVDQLQVSPAFGANIRRDRAFTDRDGDLLDDIRRRVGHHRRRGDGDESFHIHAQNGVITLFGLVDSNEEKQRIEAAIQGIPGVTEVIDRLRVEGQAGTGNYGVAPSLSPTSRTGAPSRIFPISTNFR